MTLPEGNGKTVWTRAEVGCVGSGEENDPRFPWGCSCWKHGDIRRRMYENGRVVVGFQCNRCGRWVVKPRAIAGDLESLGWYDDSVRERWRLRCDELSSQRAAEERSKAAEENRAWWERYSRYLESPEWKAKRAKVLARSLGGCEACANAAATEVHHITYAHVFDEPLFDLRAVCRPCHERLTKRDRENRERRGW